VAPVVIPRCFEDADCASGEICVDGRCVPRDALSCTEVEGGQAILQPGPPLLDFGFVGSGTAQGPLVLQNIGDCTLTVFDAYFAQEDASPFSCPFCAPERFPVELFPFRDHELRVLFTPPSVGTFEDELVLLSDDAEFPEIRVPVRARFDGVPDVAVAPTRVDFDYAPVGRAVTRTLKITNQGTGNAPLVIEDIRVESATAATFSVMPELTEPAELRPVRSDPMEAFDLTLRYQPAEIAAHEGELVIETNDRDDPVVRVPLRGSSQTPAQISVSPEAIRFGPVPIGQSTSLPLTIVNEGGTPLRVTPRWGGTGLSTDLSVMPQVVPAVAPGQFTELQVFVTATSPGPITGLLILESNDPSRPTVTVPVSAEGQDVVGAQVVKIEMSFENGSDSFFDDDFRNVDMALENPFGLICDERTPNPTTWNAFGNPSWLAFGPKEEPERIVLPDAMQDGTYRVILTYQEDCASVPAGIVAAVLGISVETLINALTGGIGTGPSSEEISSVVDNLCLNRSGTTATVTVYVNGQVIAEVPTRLGAKGELVYALDLERSNGTFTVNP
jgi:hypothetical protein